MRHILFIHPDRKLVDIYLRHLSPHFSVDSAHDGLAGLRQAKLHRPRLVISDYDLPFMSGLALLKYIRNHHEMHSTPFLFLTRSPMPHEALEYGATAWLDQVEHGPERLMQELSRHRQALYA